MENEELAVTLTPEKLGPVNAVPVEGPARAPFERLHELEKVIERGREAFIEVGEALIEIHDSRLYRKAGFSSFEEYVRKRWGWTRQNAYLHIKAAGVAENVKTSLQSGDAPSVSQAAALAPLPPERQREIAASVHFRDTSVVEITALVRQESAALAKPRTVRVVDAPSLAPAEREVPTDYPLSLVELERALLSSVRQYDPAASSVEVDVSRARRVRTIKVKHAVPKRRGAGA